MSVITKTFLDWAVSPGLETAKARTAAIPRTAKAERKTVLGMINPPLRQSGLLKLAGIPEGMNGNLPGTPAP
jgi:hypothetical protein